MKRSERLARLECCNLPAEWHGWPHIVPDETTEQELAEIAKRTGRPVWRESDPAWAEIFIG